MKTVWAGDVGTCQVPKGPGFLRSVFLTLWCDCESQEDGNTALTWAVRGCGKHTLNVRGHIHETRDFLLRLTMVATV